MKDYRPVMKNRISVRTFDGTPVEAEKLQQLGAFISDHSSGPFGTRVRIFLADLGSIPKEEMRRYGTYGIIQGASVYLVGMVKRESPPEDFGYVFEKVILKATEMGLGTCWLGGTFKRSGFARAASLEEDEILYAVSPLGYAAGRRSLADKTVRAVARSSGRKPFESLFFDGRGLEPFHKDTAGTFGDILELVRLGPSASNKQPWRIVRLDGNFHFYLERTRGYQKNLDLIDAADLQRSDVGIAMCHFETALQTAVADNLSSGVWAKEDPGLPCPYEYISTWKYR